MDHIKHFAGLYMKLKTDVGMSINKSFNIERIFLSKAVTRFTKSRKENFIIGKLLYEWTLRK